MFVFILSTLSIQFFLLLLQGARQTTETENDGDANIDISGVVAVAATDSHGAACFLAGRDECYLRGSKDPL